MPIAATIHSAVTAWFLVQESAVGSLCFLFSCVLCVVFAVCILPRPTMQCPGLTGTGCNRANGEECNEFTGVCVQDGAPECSGCADGTCLPPPFPGSQAAPSCMQNSGPSCPGTPCVGDSRCYAGFCRPCGELCGLGDLLGPLFASMGPLVGNLTVRNTTEILAGLAAAGGVLRAQAGEIMELGDNLSGQLQRLNMEQVRTSLSAHTHAQTQPNATSQC